MQPPVCTESQTRQVKPVLNCVIFVGICSPTRAAILTGRNNQRDCIEGGLGNTPVGIALGLPI